MATQEQIDELMRLFAESRPRQKASWQQRQQTMTGSAGMFGVLLCLSRADGTVTAGMLSDALQVTTGRVSILVKKMVDKGLVVRQKGAEDARVTEVKLTDKGRNIVDKLQEERNDQLKQLIDTVGMERLKDYIETQRQVFSILTPLSVDL